MLGSSRVLKLEPDYLEKRFGYAFLNAGVNYGKVEDHLALLRYYHERFQRYPQTIVLGLDVHGFSPALPVDARLLSQSQLAGLVPDAIPFRDRFHRWQELLSWQQTICSLQSIWKVVGNGSDETAAESFRTDGLLIYHERERQILAGTYDFPRSLADNQREYRQLFADYDHLSPLRRQLFQKLVRLCHDNRTRLVVFLTPLHPELADHLAGTTYPARRKELIEFLTRQATKAGFTFCDCSEIHLFGGDAQQFVDGIHPLESNTRQIIDRLLIESTR